MLWPSLALATHSPPPCAANTFDWHVPDVAGRATNTGVPAADLGEMPGNIKIKTG